VRFGNVRLLFLRRRAASEEVPGTPAELPLGKRLRIKQRDTNRFCQYCMSSIAPSTITNGYSGAGMLTRQNPYTRRALQSRSPQLLSGVSNSVKEKRGGSHWRGEMSAWHVKVEAYP
jgi:hypothetical protein